MPLLDEGLLVEINIWYKYIYTFYFPPFMHMVLTQTALSLILPVFKLLIHLDSEVKKKLMSMELIT